MRLRSASWLLASQVGNVLISFPLSVVLARALGAAGKGSLSLVQLVAELGSLVFSMGMGTATAYFAARREFDGRDVLRVIAAITLVSGFLMVLAMIVAGPGVLERWLSEESPAWVLAAGALGASLSLFASLTGYFVMGSGEVRRCMVVTLGALVFQLAADGFLWTTGRLVVKSAIAVWLIALLGTCVALVVLALQQAERRHAGAKTVFVKLWRYGIASWPVALSQYLAMRQDLLLIAYYLGTREVGIYSIAVTFAQIATFVPNALSGVLMPKIAGEASDAAAVTARMCRVSWPVVLIGALIVAAAATPLIVPLFGSGFSGSVLPLWLLVPAMAPYAVSATLSAFVAGEGKPLYAAMASTANLATNLVGNMILIPTLGIAGAALASVVSYSVGAAVMTLVFRKRTGVHFGGFLLPSCADFKDLITTAKRVLIEGFGS